MTCPLFRQFPFSQFGHRAHGQSSMVWCRRASIPKPLPGFAAFAVNHEEHGGIRDPDTGSEAGFRAGGHTAGVAAPPRTARHRLDYFLFPVLACHRGSISQASRPIPEHQYDRLAFAF